MNTTEIFLIAIAILTLAEVTYLISKMPRATVRTKGKATLIDTSVLMDGRILSIAKSGFMGDTLVIPRSVVGELQFLADNADADKRTRARFGLDTISLLQDMNEVVVEILQDGSKATEGVDERLLSLAKSNNASICTIDFNLNKVANVEGIKVLNINELAQGLRMAHLPGEKMKIELVQKGQDQHQAVGYLPDGTMVVVEHSQQLLGKTVEVEVVRSLQTAAGKMMFARRVDANQGHKKSVPSKRVANQPGKTPPPVTHKQQPAARSVERSSAPTVGATRQNQTRTRSDTAPKPTGGKRRSQSQRESAFLDLIDKQ